MNPSRLLEHFDRISDAPDAIPRLRRFILDLAVRGQLVSPSNSTLQARPLGDFAILQNGYAFKSEWFVGNGIRLLRNANVSHGLIRWDDLACLSEERAREFERFRLNVGDIVLSLDRPFIVTGTKVARVKPQDLPCLLLQRVGRFQLEGERLDADYLFLLLQSPHFTDQIDPGRSNGVPHISSRQVEAARVFVPPIDEQHRIVAKVDELMALCDRLETAQAERERRRDRLAAASLQRLNAPADTPAFREHAGFHLRHLTRMTTRPDQVAALRKTILNLAVRGHLVPQDPNDEPAATLLGRLSVGSKLLSTERATPIDEESLPYSAPRGWAWTRLCSLFRVITDGDHLPPPKSRDGIAFLTIGNITTGRLDFSDCRFVTEAYFESVAEYRRPARGDILYTVVGATYGRPAFVDTDRKFCVQRHIAILKPAGEIDVAFLCRLLASPLIYEQATRSTTGTAQPTIPLRPLRNFLAPLPPLAEQHRIVAKVDELMAVCDRLEAQLTTTQTESRRLLEAVLHQALAPSA